MYFEILFQNWSTLRVVTLQAYTLILIEKRTANQNNIEDL